MKLAGNIVKADEIPAKKLTKTTYTGEFNSFEFV